MTNSGFDLGHFCWLSWEQKISSAGSVSVLEKFIKNLGDILEGLGALTSFWNRTQFNLLVTVPIERLLFCSCANKKLNKHQSLD